MFKKIQLFAVFIVFIIFNITHAVAANWFVENVVGQAVLTKQDNSRKWIRQFDKVEPGDTIQTYSNGTVALVRNAEAMIVSSDSEISIPVEGNNSSFTLIFQKLGTILFSAKKKNRKHFEVRTPFSAAIIKGTTLAVSVNQSNAQLQVFEGVVELKRKGKRRSHIVRSGNKAVTPRNRSQAVRLNRVKNASSITPHLGSDIKQLTATYVNKIAIGDNRATKFKLTKEQLNKQTPSLISESGLKPSKAEIIEQVEAEDQFIILNQDKVKNNSRDREISDFANDNILLESQGNQNEKRNNKRNNNDSSNSKAKDNKQNNNDSSNSKAKDNKQNNGNNKASKAPKAPKVDKPKGKAPKVDKPKAKAPKAKAPKAPKAPKAKAPKAPKAPKVKGKKHKYKDDDDDDDDDDKHKKNKRKKNKRKKRSKGLNLGIKLRL